MLFFTGFSRNSNDIAKFHIKAIHKKEKELNFMKEICDEAMNYFKSDTIDNTIGKLLDEQWKIKKGITKKISNNKIDIMYDLARDNGAVGGKLLGAGGGGFMLLYANKRFHKKIKNALNDKMFVPFKFEETGSQIIYNQT